MTHGSVNPPGALLLVVPQCPHCPGVLEALSKLVKEGAIGRLEVVNVVQHPEQAVELGVRTVPWIRIGSFELEGSQSLGELRQWVEAASHGEGTGDYYQHLLESRRLDQVVAQIKARPATLRDLVAALESPETPMAVRIGIGAVMEEFAETSTLQDIVPLLDELSHSAEPQIRADACHYLSLSGTAAALAPVQRLLEDEDQEVREIARESLAILEALDKE